MIAHPRIHGLLVVLAMLAGCAAAPEASVDARSELAPTGTLRVGVVGAHTRSATFVTVENGRPHGVPVELGTSLAKASSLPVEFRVASNSGELTNWLAAGQIDVAFLPIDDARRKRVDFGPDYYALESSYLVRPGVSIGTIAEVDRAGVRVVGLGGTATVRAARRMLKSAKVVEVRSIDDAERLLRSGEADALALGRTALPGVAAKVPGSTILDSYFLRSGIAIALPKNRPNALAFATRFMNDAKDSGEIRRAFEVSGLGRLVAAPAAH